MAPTRGEGSPRRGVRGGTCGAGAPSRSLEKPSLYQIGRLSHFDWNKSNAVCSAPVTAD